MANNNNKRSKSNSNNNNTADCTITALEALFSVGQFLWPQFFLLYTHISIYICMYNVQIYIYGCAVCSRSVMIYWHATRRPLPEMCVCSQPFWCEKGVGAETTALLLLLLPNKLRYHAARLLHTTVNKFAFASIWHDRAGSCFVTNWLAFNCHVIGFKQYQVFIESFSRNPLQELRMADILLQIRLWLPIFRGQNSFGLHSFLFLL